MAKAETTIVSATVPMQVKERLLRVGVERRLLLEKGRVNMSEVLRRVIDVGLRELECNGGNGDNS